MFGGVYKGRRVFITGHTGFKGSWLSAWLLGLGAEAAGFSIGIPSRPSNFEALELAGRMRDTRGDVRDRGALGAAMRDFEPDIVFHLAAQPLVRASYEDPTGTIETNVLGVMNVLEEARRLSTVRAVVIITSDKCYRNDEWVWGYRENDRLGGSDPYSASKGCAELVAHSYFDSFYQNGAACATARAGNVIGGGDWAKDRIVPDCARAWMENRAVEIRNPLSTRPWQHVLEPLSGYLALGRKLIENSGEGGPRGQSYNFGPSADVNMPVGKVVSALGGWWPGFQSVMAGAGDGARKESGLLKLCCDKALAELGWKAALGFDETIKYTADWYAEYRGGGNMRDFTDRQIEAYCGAAKERGLEWAAD